MKEPVNLTIKCLREHLIIWLTVLKITSHSISKIFPTYTSDLFTDPSCKGHQRWVGIPVPEEFTGQTTYNESSHTQSLKCPLDPFWAGISLQLKSRFCDEPRWCFCATQHSNYINICNYTSEKMLMDTTSQEQITASPVSPPPACTGLSSRRKVKVAISFSFKRTTPHN